MSRFSYTHHITVGRAEVACEISYSVASGFAGDRIDPPYPASCEINKIEVVIEEERHGKKTVRRELAPQWLFDLLDADEDIHSDMLFEAGEDDAAAADDIRERRWEDAHSSSMGRAA